MLKCKHCGSTNVTVQAVEKQKKRGKSKHAFKGAFRV